MVHVLAQEAGCLHLQLCDDCVLKGAEEGAKDGSKRRWASLRLR